MFEARLPARKFRQYVCVGRHAAASGEKIVGRRESDGSGKAEVVQHEVVQVTKSG